MKPGHLYRRLRYGQPIIIVSGLPRSGTSMMMRMLEQGGMPILADGHRTADESNPRGYFEFAPVKDLGKNPDVSWLFGARGKAVKIVSSLLEHLPDTHNYRVIFMRRDLGEVIASQNTMLTRRGEAATESADLTRSYEKHLQRVLGLLARRRSFALMEVNYTDALYRPLDEGARVAAFTGRPLDTARMAAAVEKQLYRQRRGGSDGQTG
jgi:hypothetical protein